VSVYVRARARIYFIAIFIPFTKTSRQNCLVKYFTTASIRGIPAQAAHKENLQGDGSDDEDERIFATDRNEIMENYEKRALLVAPGLISILV
jgi:hypothetical protein